MNTSRRVTVECHVRGSAFAGSIGNVVGALREHEEAGAIDGLTVDVWPDRVCLTDETAEAPIFERYDRLREWAERHDASLEPAFRLAERTMTVIDSVETVLELPVVCLVVRVEGDIETVAPHSAASATYTVEDALDDIDAGRFGSPRGSPAPTRSSDATRVPDVAGRRSD
jgi:hypothetical protein